MPDIKEDVIVDVKIQRADAEKQVDNLTKKITGLKTSNAELLKVNKELEKTGQANSKQYIDNAKQIELNKQKINENTASRKSLITTINAEDNSIKALTARNKELIKQRNEINTGTAEGRAKIALLNNEIDKNNETIKVNNDALGKQKINIGNYSSALDKLVPGLGAAVQGTKAMTTASLAFIATPIGAIIGALGLALAALIAYFKGSEEGQNRLNRLMNIGGAIMEKVMDVVEAFGGALFDAFENPKKALSDLIDFLGENLLNRVKAFAVIWEGIVNLDFDKLVNGAIQLQTGITNALEKAQAFGKEIGEQAEDALHRAEELSKIQERINKNERDLILLRAQTGRDVAKLIVESQELEGQARLDKVNEAIALEKKLLVAEKNFVAEKLALAKHHVEDDPTIENKKAYVEAVAAQFKAEEDFFAGIRRLDRQRIAAQQEIQKERLEIYESHLEEEHKLYLAAKALRDEAREEEEERIKSFNERITRETEARLKKEGDAKKKAVELEKKLEKLKLDYQLGALEIFTKEKSQARIIGTAILKKDAIQETFTNTYAAAVGAYKALASIPYVGPVLGAIAAAAVTAFGLTQVARIAGVQFANGGKVPGYAGGGLSGTKINNNHGIPISRPNGDNRLATVKTGEVILNERQQAALGGPRTFHAIGVPGFDEGGFTGFTQTREVNRRIEQAIDARSLAAMLNAQKIVLPIQDFEVAQEAKNAPINKAQVI